MRLINAAFRVEEFFVIGDRIQPAEVAVRLNTGQFFLAERDGAPAGCVYIEPQEERAYLGLLSVDPAQQHSGIGKFLMAAAEQHCRAFGCRFVDLRIVNLRQELPAFYQRLGYVASGTAPFSDPDRAKLPCHFIIMSKQIG